MTGPLHFQNKGRVNIRVPTAQGNGNKIAVREDREFINFAKKNTRKFALDTGNILILKITDIAIFAAKFHNLF